MADVLQPGCQQVAAGYVMYGSSTMLVYTTGQGVHGFTLDPTIGEFLLSHERIITPRVGTVLQRQREQFRPLGPAVQTAVRGLKGDIPDGMKPKNSRYIGSLVADFHRNLISGGVFLYPADTRNTNGKLRLLYEASPMAFIAEQARGKRDRRSQPHPGHRAQQSAPADAAGDRESGGRGIRGRHDPQGRDVRRVSGASHRRCDPTARREPKSVYGPSGLGRRPRARPRPPRASFRSPAASIPTCTPAGSGPCASTPASAPRRRPTSASAGSSPQGRWASPRRSIFPPRWATTRTTRWRRARWAVSAWRSTRWTTWPTCSATSRSTASPPR